MFQNKQWPEKHSRIWCYVKMYFNKVMSFTCVIFIPFSYRYWLSKAKRGLVLKLFGNDCKPRRGYLMERWVRGCAAQKGCFFGLSGLPMALFYLKFGLDIGCVFAKYIIFNEFCLNKCPSLNKWFRHRLQICVFSGFSYRVVVETSGHTSVPSSKLSTPRAANVNLTLDHFTIFMLSGWVEVHNAIVITKISCKVSLTSTLSRFYFSSHNHKLPHQ